MSSHFLLRALSAVPLLGRLVPRPAPETILLPLSGALPSLARAAALVWRRRAGMLLGDDLRAFETAMTGLLQTEWRRRCRVGGVVIRTDAPVSARRDRLLTPSFVLDAFPGPAGPDPATEFGRQIEMAMADLFHAARERAAVGEVGFYGERRAYMFQHFLYVTVYDRAG